MRPGKQIPIIVLIAASVWLAAGEASAHPWAHKAGRFLTYVTSVQTSGVKASLVEHLLLGVYYANQGCSMSRPT